MVFGVNIIMSNDINRDNVYNTAKSLAADLAERELQCNIADMYIEHSAEKARMVRKQVEENYNGSNSGAAQEYKSAERSIYGAVYQLLEGYKGYKLIKVEGAQIMKTHEWRSMDSAPRIHR